MKELKWFQPNKFTWIWNDYRPMLNCLHEAKSKAKVNNKIKFRQCCTNYLWCIDEKNSLYASLPHAVTHKNTYWSAHNTILLYVQFNHQTKERPLE